MRPNDNKSRSELYECFDCGDRTESPNTPTCTSCGGTLRNLGVPRDL